MDRLRETYLKHLTNECKVDANSTKNYFCGEKISDVNTVHTMIGQSGSLTGWHVEDLNIASVNYLREGAPKYWVV